MPPGTDLAAQYTTTFDLILRLTDTITHAESLRQPSFDTNCMNWLLGHVTVSRLNLLALLGHTESVWDFTQARRYIPGTPPITGDADDVTDFADILHVFADSQAVFVPLLHAQTTAALAVTHDNRTLGVLLAYYAQHEAFHAGQVELCRAMLGKPTVRGFE